MLLRTLTKWKVFWGDTVYIYMLVSRLKGCFMALNGLFCADMPLKIYSLTHSRGVYTFLSMTV